MEKLKTWLRNAKSFHHRIMARYLKKRGWVVFYLEPRDRICVGIDGCWLNSYNSQK